jgi:nitroimidazol reductase NimA-like FMN-containing flavoprotein (pyridoxamine 5'-phosphate oxidase superfamily)
MTDDRPQNVSSEIRYGSLAVEDDAWIREFLARVPTGVLALPTDGPPHVLTQLFVHDDDSDTLFFHGAQGGRAYDIVAGDEPLAASFTASEMGRVLPAEKPVNFNVEYASVVARGTLSLVDDDAEKLAALERFMAKYAPQLTVGEDYDPIADASVDRTAVYRFTVEAWSGKHGEKPADFPGAFGYEPAGDAE